VLDNLDLAWAHLGAGKGEGDSVSEEARALGQARHQLLDVLGREGLERVDAVGVPFDPTVHDAVAHTQSADADADADESAVAREGGGADGAGAGAGDGHDERSDAGRAATGAGVETVSVDEVMRAGYRWRGQVLRPAMVRVRG
ncbi:MAG TPA: nucleotide exchange factor GrpE, partial [Acidimicrobiales bacterium]|nr:nucleotide exchange factor GrpE [Acidimicrobiales bacterium]